MSIDLNHPPINPDGIKVLRTKHQSTMQRQQKRMFLTSAILIIFPALLSRHHLFQSSIITISFLNLYPVCLFYSKKSAVKEMIVNLLKCCFILNLFLLIMNVDPTAPISQIFATVVLVGFVFYIVFSYGSFLVKQHYQHQQKKLWLQDVHE